MADNEQAGNLPNTQNANTIFYNDLAGVNPPKFDWAADDPASTFRKFKRYCEILLSTPTFESKQGADKVNYILLWLGPQGVEIFDSWNLTAEQASNPVTVWKKFSDYFEPKTNFRLARYQLRDIRQQSNESSDGFLTRLRTQAKKCNYGADFVKEVLIDQFIVGTLHAQVRKQILDHKQDTLTLEDCVNYGRTYEATKSQAQHFSHSPTESNVSSVKKRKPRQSKQSAHPHQTSRAAKPQASSEQPNKNRCMWCGGERHKRAQCPAKESQCSKCKKLGHWSSACLSTKHSNQRRSVHSVEHAEQDDDF